MRERPRPRVLDLLKDILIRLEQPTRNKIGHTALETIFFVWSFSLTATILWLASVKNSARQFFRSLGADIIINY